MALQNDDWKPSASVTPKGWNPPEFGGLCSRAQGGFQLRRHSWASALCLHGRCPGMYIALGHSPPSLRAGMPAFRDLDKTLLCGLSV